jgi:Tol biopolymer transport system component
VYVIRSEKGAQAQRVTTENANFLPAWSADGRFLYFVSNRTGNPTIWRVPAEGGPNVQISRNYAFDPQASLDGKYLYIFADRSPHAPVHRIDLATLKEEPLIENVMDRGISVTQRGLYFLRRHSDQTTVTLNFFDPLVNRERELRKLFTKMNGGLEVRRDDRTALVTATEFMATDLMLVEDFQ